MDLKKIKKRLEAEQAGWQFCLDRAEGQEVGEGEPLKPDNTGDASVHTTIKSEVAGSARVYRTALNRVEAALGRLAAGTFGICTKCRGTIEEDRIEVQPDLELCRACAEKARRDAEERRR